MADRTPLGGMQVFPIALAGGLSDSKAVAESSDMQILWNFVVYRNRFAVRAPMVETVQLLDDAGSPAAVTSVLALQFHQGFIYAIAHSTVTDKHYLYKLTAAGLPLTPGDTTSAPYVVNTTEHEILAWADADPATPIMVSFDAGDIDEDENRLYICDADGNQPTIFFKEDGTTPTITEQKDDFADTGTAKSAFYTYMFKYNFHMWGCGFYQNNAGSPIYRPEMIRFSQPGLISAQEPDVVNNISRDWWSIDHREVGQRGTGITTVGYAGGAAIIFKNNECYALFGYDAESWSLRLLSDKVGCVGPYAAASTEDGICVFWSAKGPCLTDGQTVVEISQNIRRGIQLTKFSVDISAEYSPDDSTVYFVVPGSDYTLNIIGSPPSSTTTPDTFFAYQRQAPGGNPGQPASPIGLWAAGQWLAHDGNAFKPSMLRAVPNETPLGPAGPPTDLAGVGSGE